jgi:uncharacterized repeat protein (TIGR01451 family)
VRIRNGSSAARLAVCAATAAGVAGLLALGIAFPAMAASAPDVTIAKVSNASGPVAPGDHMTYTITVENAGDATAHDVHVQDDLPVGVAVTTLVPAFPGGQCTVVSSVAPPAPEHWSVTCTRSSLAAGASAAVSFDVRLTSDVACGSLTNTTSVEASDEPAALRSDDEASAKDTVTCPPSISLTKTAPRYGHVGKTLSLQMRVRNDGDTDLHGVSVTDPGCDAAPTLRSDGNGDATLSPHENWTYGCTHVVRADAETWFATTARVEAASAHGSAHASARSTTRVLRPSLTISVRPEPLSGTPGDTVTYRFVVRNDGDATLTDLVVRDDQLGHVGTAGTLAPGHTVTFAVDRVLSAHHVWVTDTVTASAKDPSGHPVSARGRASVSIVASSGNGPTTGGGDGTAFTGSDATVPGLASILLAAAGIASLLVAARRRT